MSENEVTAAEVVAVDVPVEETLTPQQKAALTRAAKKAAAEAPVSESNVVLGVSPEWAENAPKRASFWLVDLGRVEPVVEVDGGVEEVSKEEFITDIRDIPVAPRPPKEPSKTAIARAEYFAKGKRLYGAVKKHSRSHYAHGLPGWHWVAEGDPGFTPDELWAIVIRTKTPEAAIAAVQRKIDKRLIEDKAKGVVKSDPAESVKNATEEPGDRDDQQPETDRLGDLNEREMNEAAERHEYSEAS